MPPSSAHRPPPANPALRILLFTNSLILVGAAMIAPIYALLVARVGGDLLDASATGSVFALVAGLTVLVSGRYGDRRKARRRIVVFGYCLIGCGFLLYILAHSILWLLAVQVVVGLGEAIYAPAFDGLFSSHLDPGFESREWGGWEASHYFSTALGAILGGFIVQAFGFDALFATMGALCFLSAACIGRVPRNVV